MHPQVRRKWQPSSSLRLINSQKLGIEALKTMNASMSSALADIMDTPGVPFDVLQKLAVVRGTASTVYTAVEDLKQENNHMAPCSIHQHTEAIRDRQSTWLKSSNLPQPLQSEVTKAPEHSGHSWGEDSG